MTITIALNLAQLTQLDLSPAVEAIAPILTAPNPETYHNQIRFTIDFPRDPTDPRELSEIPEIRLWFLRLDAHYPWLPFCLDWSQELARYTAMLVPHQFSRTEGIQFNPEALEILITTKIFTIHHWLQSKGVNSYGKLQAMTQTLGYSLADEFLAQL